MSYFDNIQSGGAWVQGGTYSFLVKVFGTLGAYGSCSIGGQPGFLLSPAGGLWGDEDTTVPEHSGNILFDNDGDSLSGGIVLDDVSWVDQGDDWWKVTVIIPADLPVGNYYLKYGTYWECQAFS